MKSVLVDNLIIPQNHRPAEFGGILVVIWCDHYLLNNCEQAAPVTTKLATSPAGSNADNGFIQSLKSSSFSKCAFEITVNF